MRNPLPAAAALLAGLALAGCLTRPSLVRESFALVAPAREGASAKVPSTRPVLALKYVEVSNLFDGRLLVYRTGETTWERDPYAEWMTTPGRMLADAMAEGLRASGPWLDVVGLGSTLRAGEVAEVTVTGLYGDFRLPAEPYAVFSLRVSLVSPGRGMTPATQALHKEYRRRERISARTPAALVEGLNRELSSILAEAASDAAALPPAPPPLPALPPS